LTKNQVEFLARAFERQRVQAERDACASSENTSLFIAGLNKQRP